MENDNTKNKIIQVGVQKGKEGDHHPSGEVRR